MSLDQIPAKLFGAIVGALLALVLHAPTGMREAIRRTVVSVVVGMIGSAAIIHHAGWPAVGEFSLLAAMIASYLAWPVMKRSWRIASAYIGRKAEGG